MLVAGDGHFIAGTLVMIIAYSGSFFVSERLFRVLKPKLLILPWFGMMWSWFVTVRDMSLGWLSSKWMLGRKAPFWTSAQDLEVEPQCETAKGWLFATFVM